MKTVQSNQWKAWATAVSAFAVLLIFSAASTLLAFIPVQAEPVPAQTAPQEVKVKVPKPKPTVSSRQVLEAAPAPIPHPVIVSTSKAAGKQQAQQEKITGTILDPTGGVIPGVTISVFDTRTKELLGTTFSAANGSFEIFPPAGNYSIQFASPGFQTQVFSNSQLGLNPLVIQMELGQINETVTVVTAAPATAPARILKEPIRVGGHVVPPKLVKTTDPLYPPEARDANVEGTVVVSALIDAEGNVKDAVVFSGHRLLRDAALESVGQWRYQPALVNGEPWPMKLLITIIFKLRRID